MSDWQAPPTTLGGTSYSGKSGQRSLLTWCLVSKYCLFLAICVWILFSLLLKSSPPEQQSRSRRSHWQILSVHLPYGKYCVRCWGFSTEEADTVPAFMKLLQPGVRNCLFQVIHSKNTSCWEGEVWGTVEDKAGEFNLFGNGDRHGS